MTFIRYLSNVISMLGLFILPAPSGSKYTLYLSPIAQQYIKKLTLQKSVEQLAYSKKRKEQTLA